MARKLLALLGSARDGRSRGGHVHRSPAAAAVVPRRWCQGHDLAAAGLLEFRDQCRLRHPTTRRRPTPLGLQGGTVGTPLDRLADGSSNFEVGALAPVGHPTSLNTFAGDVVLPDGTGTGTAVAFYFETPAATAGFWFGFRSSTSNAEAGSRRHREPRRLDVRLVLRIGPTPTSTTRTPDRPRVRRLASVATAGARTSVWLMGCDRRPYYVDNLRVADASTRTLRLRRCAPPVAAGLARAQQAKKESSSPTSACATARRSGCSASATTPRPAGLPAAGQLSQQADGTSVTRRSARAR